MKKAFFLICCAAFIQFKLHAQDKKTSSETKVSKTDIEVVYNQYLQNGDHSAVTGGIGTEELVIYGPQLYFNHQINQHHISISGGVDVVSSASVDKIDFIPSSASSLDSRVYLNGGYGIHLEKSKLFLQGGVSGSIESDYLSLGTNLGLKKTSKNDLREFTFQLQAFFDNLQYNGFINKGGRPSELIYALELRGTDWFDISHRRSYNVQLGLSQVINKRNILGIYPAISYQEGLLSTPFHRVYLDNSLLVVENLPRERWKFALAGKWNTFLGGQFILRNTAHFFTDNWGVQSFYLENETVFKFHPSWGVFPNLRYYQQFASQYFAPYLKHDQNSLYHSSDYDLSAFSSFTLGLGFQYFPEVNLLKFLAFSDLTFRYYYLTRSDGLFGHTLSLSLHLGSLQK